MRVPSAVTAVVHAIRELGFAIPAEYCQPQCPNCRVDCQKFMEESSCLPNSSFIANCGSCQQCVITYEIQQKFLKNGTIPPPSVPSMMSVVIDLCKDSPASSDVAALQSQASRVSALGSQLASTMASSASASATAMQTSAPFDPSVNVASPSATSTAIQTAVPDSNTPLSPAWIAGPVAGSIMGIATVLIVIHYTRKKQRKDPVMLEAPKMDFDDGDSTESRPQLHSDCVVELANTEVNAPVELPAVEPVGMELNTPCDSHNGSEDWPLPLSPLPLLFAMTELRDERTGFDDSPKHETFYHP